MRQTNEKDDVVLSRMGIIQTSANFEDEQEDVSATRAATLDRRQRELQSREDRVSTRERELDQARRSQPATTTMTSAEMNTFNNIKRLWYKSNEIEDLDVLLDYLHDQFGETPRTDDTAPWGMSVVNDDDEDEDEWDREEVEDERSPWLDILAGAMGGSVEIERIAREHQDRDRQEREHAREIQRSRVQPRNAWSTLTASWDTSE